MSVTLMALVFKLPVCASLKLLLLSLADFANDKGGSIFPSVRTLAKKSSMTERSVQRGLRALEGRGWLVKVAPARYDAPATYQLHVDALVELVRGDSPSPGDTGRRSGVSPKPRGVTSTTSRGEALGGPAVK